MRLHLPCREQLLSVAASLSLLALLPGAGLGAVASQAAPVAVEQHVDSRAIQESTVQERASRSRTLPTVPEVDPLASCAEMIDLTHANGQLPSEALCALPGHVDHALRPDAARALVALSAAYEQWFGEALCLTDSYRSLGSQQALAVRKPGLAAVPGTSEHGWGLAVDFACGVEGYDTPQHRWMIANGARFGWEQPAWAKDGGEREEPWHWEFRPPSALRATAR